LKMCVSISPATIANPFGKVIFIVLPAVDIACGGPRGTARILMEDVYLTDCRHLWSEFGSAL